MSDLEKYKHFLNDMNIKYREGTSDYKGNTYTQLDIDTQHIQDNYGSSLSINFVDGNFKDFETWGE